MKTVILTGSKGYIGTNFIQLYNKEFNIIPVDRKNGRTVDELTKKYSNWSKIDNIIHLAAISGIKECDKNIDQTIIDNIESTISLTNVATLYNIPITFASSQAAINPKNTYALTKRISERYISNLKKYTILRFANVYGGKNYLKLKTSVVANFINAEKKGLPLNINGNGDQSRDFIHVDDICRSIYLSLNYPVNDTIDIGTGISTTILDLAMMISSNIKFNLDCNSGIESNIADTTKAFDSFSMKFKAKNKLKDYIFNEINRI